MTHIRINRLDEVDALLELRAKSEAWTGGRGLDQYQDAAFADRARQQIADLAARGRFCVLTDDSDEMLAVGALVGPDMDFWTADDDLGSAWYVGRLMVARHGQSYGSRLLDLIALSAANDGRKWLRLDCWRTNYGLQDYYRAEGFEFVRVVEHPKRFSGALFQRPVHHLIPEPWDRHTDDTPKQAISTSLGDTR